MTTATINTSPDPDQEADEIEEPEDAALRRKPGLRPSVYSDHSDGQKGLHPDQRPCPLWCWVGQHEVFGHEMDPSHPLEAGHEMESIPNVVASLYPGAPAIGAEDRFVRTATLEPRLHQLGQDPPTVDVGFRRFDGRDQLFDDEFLRLTITDARELAVALNYLVEIAERG